MPAQNIDETRHPLKKATWLPECSEHVLTLGIYPAHLMPENGITRTQPAEWCSRVFQLIVNELVTTLKKEALLNCDILRQSDEQGEFCKLFRQPDIFGSVASDCCQQRGRGPFAHDLHQLQAHSLPRRAGHQGNHSEPYGAAKPQRVGEFYTLGNNLTTCNPRLAAGAKHLLSLELTAPAPYAPAP